MLTYPVRIITKNIGSSGVLPTLSVSCRKQQHTQFKKHIIEHMTYSFTATNVNLQWLFNCERVFYFFGDNFFNEIASAIFPYKLRTDFL